MRSAPFSRTIGSVSRVIVADIGGFPFLRNIRMRAIVRPEERSSGTPGSLE
jgi:hypothetical protein